MDKLEEDWNGLKVWIFEKLIVKRFFKVLFVTFDIMLGSVFAAQETAILSLTSNFFVNVKFHGA